MNNHNKKHHNVLYNESWLSRTWRPAMAFTYLIICVFDFIIFPILYGMYSFYYKETMIQNWVPLTLQGGGMLHLSMGAILGITSYTKGTTQTAMVNNGVYASPDANTASVSTPTASVDTDTPSDTVKRPIPRIKT